MKKLYSPVSRLMYDFISLLSLPLSMVLGDAPESSQLCRGDDSLQYRCGAKATNDLDAFIAQRPAICVPASQDQYGRSR